MKNIFIFILVLIYFESNAQNVADSVIVNSYIENIQNLYLSNPDSAIIICNEALIYSKSHQSPYLEANTLGWLGYINRQKGRVKEGIEFLVEGLKILEDNNLPKTDIASAYSNLGSINDELKNYKEALAYYQKSLVIRKEINDLEGISNSLYNIAGNYSKQGEYEKSIKCYNEGLIITDSINFPYGIAYYNLGLSSVYFLLKKYSEAIIFTQKALTILKELGDKRGVSYNHYSLGRTYFELKNYKLAEDNLLESLSIANEIGYPRTITDASLVLHDLYKIKGNYNKALLMYELHIQMRDSIHNELNQKAIIRQQINYDFEKAQILKNQEVKEFQRLEDEKTKRRDNLQYSIILVGILVVFGLVLSVGFVSVSPKFAEGLIFFAFLILFEFLLVLSDPYVDNYTGGEPMYKLILNAAMAGLIFPLHAFFEKYLKDKLIK